MDNNATHNFRMNELLTVIIQTSPIPSHPSTALLEALFRSFVKVDGLLESKIIILCDGVDVILDDDDDNSSKNDANNNNNNNNEQQCHYGKTKKKRKEKAVVENPKHGKVSRETAQAYKEHLERLRTAVSLQQSPFVPYHEKGGSIELVELSERHGSAKAIQAAFLDDPKLISTPLVMIGQHDNFFIQSVPLRACAHVMMMQEQRQSSSSSSSSLSSLQLPAPIQCLHFMSTATMNYPQKVQKRYGIQIKEYDIQLKHDAHDNAQRDDDDDNNNNNNNDDDNCQYKLIPLIFWYGRTHLSYAQHYRTNILHQQPPLKVGDHLEEILGVQQLRDIQKRGFQQAFPKYGTYVLDQGIGEVLYHLSGRRARAATETMDTTMQNDSEDNKKDTTKKTPVPSLDTTAGTASLASSTFSSSSSNPADDIIVATQAEPTNSNDKATSFTTARSCQAIVPGLEIIPSSSSNKAGDNKKQTTTTFKQKCFHCGIKGHSYKYCPSMTTQSKPKTETIDLS